MNKLTALIEAAKAATPGPWVGKAAHAQGYGWVTAPNGGTCTFGKPVQILSGQYRKMGADALFIALANPATILELCALLEKAGAALEEMVERAEEPSDANCSCFISPPCNDCVDYGGLREAFSDSRNALAAIKQWKGE